MEVGIKVAIGDHISGWMWPEELTWLYETAKEMPRIAEIGSWEGRSTFALCSGCPGTVYAIDHFKGSAEHQKQPVIMNGRLRKTFNENMKDFKNLAILPMTSADAAMLFKDRFFDMVFIDGSHDYDSVMLDLKLWSPKTKMICGHDITRYDVPRAVEAFLGNVKRQPGTLWSKQL